MKDFSFKFEGNFNILVNFFVVQFFSRDFEFKIEGEFSIFDFLVSINFLRDFRLIELKLISFFVARYLTVSLRGPVLKPYGEGDSPSFGLVNDKRTSKTYRFLKGSKHFLTQTRAVALAVRFEHWTPKGDCKLTGKKERNMTKKKNHQKIEIAFNFK